MLSHHPAVYLFLYVDDLDRARAFYERTLGLTVLEIDPGAVKYDAGEIILALNRAEDFGIAPSDEKDRTQLIVFHTEDLDATRAALEAQGVRFTGPTERYEIGATAMFFDPDGHCLMLYEPSAESLSWPSGDKVHRILEAQSREHSILRVLAAHRSAAPSGGDRARDEPPRVLADAKVLYIFHYVTDLADARSFYAERLGLPILEEDEGVGVVKYDAGGVILATHLVETQPNASRNEHMTVPRRSALVFLVDDARSEVRALEARGVSFETGVHESEIGAIARFRDPDGHTFFLYQISAAAETWPSGAKISHIAGEMVDRAA